MRASPSATDRLRLLVVDDHDVVHWGLRIMLERLPWIERSYSAHNGSEAVECTTRNRVDLALVDLFVGSESGADICQRLRQARPEVRVLLISGVGQMSPKAAEACGASGFVSKDSRGREIIRAVARIARGGSVYADEGQENQEAAGLSEREQQVLTLVAAGSTNREIATQLQLSPHTVKEYASTLYRKLEVRNRLEAVKRAQRLGLIH